jgi:hypothetical protein
LIVRQEYAMTYLAVVQGDDWTSSRDDVARALRERWPDVEVELGAQGPESDPTRDVVWYQGSGMDRLEGSAHVNGQGIYVDGQNELVAPVIAWYRSLVPAHEEVVLCDDTYSFDSVLAPGITADDVVAILREI